jgi:hypothetical protein
MTTWQKFLKETIPSRKARMQFQMFMGHALTKHCPAVSQNATKRG